MTTTFSRALIAEESTFSRLTKFQGQKVVAWSGRATQALRGTDVLALTLPSQSEERSRKKGKSPAEHFLGSTRESAQHTILLDSALPNLAKLRFQTLICGSIVQHDSRQGWVDNWNG
jgi:hypothetical protein